MKFLLATVVVAVIGANALPSPQPGDDIFCLAVCLPEKPVCPVGQAPTGSPSCWGCCKPAPTLCIDLCLLKKPECPVGQAPTGVEGCWGCCQPISGTACIEQCLAEKPECPVGEAPTGREGCWGCCQPTNSF